MSLTPSYTFQGTGNWSLDATSGAATGGGTIQADVPTGSHIEKAFLYNTTYGGTAGSVTLGSGSQSETVSDFTSLGSDANLTAYRADVTDFVSSVVGSGSSTEFNFTVSNIVNSPDSDGYELAIVYSNPSETDRTIAFLDGATNSAGDTFSINFAKPVDTTQSGFSALMSLGIGFSFQPSSQYSIITVNGRQLSTSAGGQDDGVGQDGGLITVGGIGDSTDNPDPNVLPTSSNPDDELYDLAKGNNVDSTPFIKNGDTSIAVTTRNPSGDDNIFFAGINVTASASVTSNTVVGPGQTLTVSAGQTLSNVLVESGGTLDVSSGGTVEAVVIDGGGRENVFSGGVDSGTTISSGGFEEVFGSASGTVILNGGSQTVEAGGVVTGAVLDGVGLQLVFGLADGTVVSAGDEQLVQSGGVASDTVVLSGGLLAVASGGTASTAAVSSGGQEVVSAGGLDSGTTISSGGFEEVFGSAGGTVILNGGSQTVEAGGAVTGAVLDGVGLQDVLGFAGGTVVGSGDEQLVEAGGSASGTTISSGGLEVVLSGGVTSDTTIAGGTLELADGAAAQGAITFGGSGGTLGLDGATMPAATVSGLVAGDVIDERLIGFAASDTAQLDSNNLLTVSGGGSSVSLQFDNSVAGKAFAISDDGSGGAALTLTSDTTAPVTASATLSVSAGGGAAALGITAPSDVDNAAAALTISVTALPSNGTVTLADGTTAVTLGESLTLAQLTGLDFTPATGQGGTSSQFGYSVSDPAGNTASGTATIKVTGGSRLFDFVFTYTDGKDYYRGTVADDGTFGYSVGQTKTLATGSYDIFGAATGTTSEAAGTVFVTDYSHGGPGLASTTPVKTSAGTADGTAGLGSESDAVLGLDGRPNAFSSTREISLTPTRLYGFVFSYADGAVYTGTVADDSSAGLPSSKTVTDAAGNVLGVYSIYRDGSTTRAAGTVVVDRFLANGLSVLTDHSGAGAVDGKAGLGSEVGTITVGQVAHEFSPTTEPTLSGGPAIAAVTLAPDTTAVTTTEVNQIYNDILGRFPTQSELDTASGELNDGTSLSTVRSTLAATSEAQSDLTQLYRQIFARAATSSELVSATSDLTNGSSLASLQLGLADSSEAAGDINQIYLDVLDRAADAGGTAAFTAGLGNETPGNLSDPGGLAGLAGVRDVLAHSGEAADDLTTLFRGVLGRAPGAAELVGMEDQLAKKGNTQATLQSALRATGSAGGFTTIAAPTGAATLVAAPAPTLFGFSDIAFGNDTISGFDTTRDTIELSKSLVADFTTLKADTTSSGGGSLITLDHNRSILISGIAPASLTAANFLFL